MNNSHLIRLLFGISVLFTLPNLAYAVYPCVDIRKEVSVDGGLTWHDANTEAEAVTVINNALYKLTIKRCDYDGLIQVQIMDEMLSFFQNIENFPYVDQWNDYGVYVGLPNLEAEARSIIIDAPDTCKTYTGTVLNTATVTATGQNRYWATVSDSDDAWIRCEPQIGGGEGCTPGYWKQDQHFDSWPEGITPDTLYSDVFGRVITVRIDKNDVTDPTLLQALSALGGRINTAARHSTAAYLNSVSHGVSYDLNAAQVISNAQSSIDSNDYGALIEALVNFNEQGCPLN